MAKKNEFVESRELEQIGLAIATAQTRAKTASETSLTDMKEIGEHLKTAKELAPHGEYLLWAKRKFGFSRQWCARLTDLADSWQAFEKACRWATNKGDVLGPKQYSVDGALALIREMKRAEGPSEMNKTPRPKRKTETEWKAEVDDLRHQLAKAQSRIKELEAHEWAQLQIGTTAPSPEAHTPAGHTPVSSSANVQSTGHLDPDISSDESPPAMDAVASFDDVQTAVSDEEADQEMAESTS